jgi:hypothetical protein
LSWYCSGSSWYLAWCWTFLHAIWNIESFVFIVAWFSWYSGFFFPYFLVSIIGLIGSSYGLSLRLECHLCNWYDSCLLLVNVEEMWCLRIVTSLVLFHYILVQVKMAKVGCSFLSLGNSSSCLVYHGLFLLLVCLQPWMLKTKFRFIVERLGFYLYFGPWIVFFWFRFVSFGLPC